MEKSYEQLVNEIIDLVGGKENISLFTHCVTRLRFNVKDKGIVNTEKITSLKGTAGIKWVGNQLQIIIGQHVDDVYQSICGKYGFLVEKQVAENLDEKEKTEKLTIKSVFATIADVISSSLIPFIPVLIGTGMIKVLCLLLTTFSILEANSSTYTILSIVGDAGFYFLPVFVGKGAAKKFGADEGLGMLMGLMLVAPSFVSLVDSGAEITFLGIKVYSGYYSYLVFPVILSCAVMAPIEKFFKNHSPNMLRVIVEPFCTLLVMIPLVFIVIAPLGSILGTYITSFLMWLYNTTGFFGMAILGALYPFLVITGMHSATTPYWLESFEKFGYEPIVSPIDCLNNINQGVAAIATAYKTKNAEIKSTGFSCGMTALVAGISEPSLFGNNVRYRIPLIGACIGNFIGAGFCGLFKVYCYNVYGTGGLFAVPCYIGPTSSNLVLYLLGMLLGAVATFVFTYIFYKDEKKAEK